MRLSTRIVIFTDEPGWHGARLKEAFAQRGVEPGFVSLRDCHFDLSRAGDHVRISGFGTTLPEGVFVRGVPGGTLEQVILRLDVLHALKALGVPVYNDGRAIERTVDKAMTSFVLANAGIPAPATWVTESAHEARAIVMRESAAGHELVVKPLFGSQGTGLRRIASVAELPPEDDYGGVYYLQRFIGQRSAPWHDWRVFVINGAAVAAMIRRGRTWISNVAQGARCESVDLSAEHELRELAQSACRALDMSYAGVDLIRDREGRLEVVEVNGIPAWKGLQSVSTVNIAQRLVDDFLERLLPQPVLHSAA
ncbi:MAG: ATP-grasp domain-containing protein [Burkholderiales bacterium]